MFVFDNFRNDNKNTVTVIYIKSSECSLIEKVKFILFELKCCELRSGSK